MPKTRSATLRVAHQRDCASVNRTSLDSLKGCSCTPSYYTLHRDHHGRPVKGTRVRDRQVADRALRKLLVEIDEGRVGVGSLRRKTSTFDEWTAVYLENLERDKGDKLSTIRAYRATFGYARPALGGLDLDEIGLPELREVVRRIRERSGSDANLHKHLRHLRAALTAAVEEGYALSNPLTRKFIQGLRLTVPNRVESYTDVELAKVWPTMDALGYEPVYVAVAKAAVATGARLGELIALDWDDINLSERVLEIRWHYDSVDGKVKPKDGEPRTVYLIEDENEAINGVAVFERWTAHCGVRPGDSPIFPPPRGASGRLNGQYVSRLVQKACREAGIAEEGEGGRKRKPFHALRGTYTRICRETGYPDELIQHNLGHSTPVLTQQVYGQWSVDALRTAARRRAPASA